MLEIVYPQKNLCMYGIATASVILAVCHYELENLILWDMPYCFYLNIYFAKA